MLRSPQLAYAQTQKTTGSAREVEAEALFKAARRLEECQRRWGGAGAAARLDEALRINQKLWTIFQTELSRPDRELPDDLRENLLRISLFIDRRTFEVMRSPSPEKLTALIEINRHIAAGLTSTL